MRRRSLPARRIPSTAVCSWRESRAGVAAQVTSGARSAPAGAERGLRGPAGHGDGVRWGEDPRLVMPRHVLTINLKDDPAAIEAYRRHHAQVWPEVVESLRQSGVQGMDIHLLGRRLVMILEIEDGLDVERVFAAHRVSNPRVAEWEALMKALQEPVDAAAPGTGWAVMERVFHLNADRSLAASPAREHSRKS